MGNLTGQAATRSVGSIFSIMNLSQSATSSVGSITTEVAYTISIGTGQVILPNARSMASVMLL